MVKDEDKLESSLDVSNLRIEGLNQQIDDYVNKAVSQYQKSPIFRFGNKVDTSQRVKGIK